MQVKITLRGKLRYSKEDGLQFSITFAGPKNSKGGEKTIIKGSRARGCSDTSKAKSSNLKDLKGGP
jgi:hypothetical protein